MPFRSRIACFQSLKAFSTLEVGGRAKELISVQTIKEMQDVYRYTLCKNIPFIVIGKGSNILFDDRGFSGLVIVNKIDFIQFNEGILEVGGGASFSFLGTKFSKKGWGGLEFASGIPGSIGGAIYMNAGANGMQTSDCLHAVGYIDAKGNVVEQSKESLSFGYRTSSFQKKKNWIIVFAKFKLKKNPEAQKKQLKMIQNKLTTQPYKEKSAGCFFRNPQGESAGALIDACGLKGKRIGDAQISTMHANFIINRGNATAQDILDLVKIVQKKVKQKTGKMLEIEVQTIPYRLGTYGSSFS